ncbi:MAG: imidazolonepropionase [Steroidobacteraceae bacterium]
MEAKPSGHCDLLLTGGRLVTCEDLPAAARAIPDSAMAIQAGRIAWTGRSDAVPPRFMGLERVDVEGALVTPGLIDCHTHLVFAGDRSTELQRRLAGESYASIAASGGGILSTVAATRAAGESRLLELATLRAQALMAEGVTTIEIKSGYGLDLDSELQILRVARRLPPLLGIGVHTTLLAAHAVPPEFAGRADDYLDHVRERILPAAVEAGLADSVDAFCETIAFSSVQVRRLFDAASAAGLRVRLHADQLSDTGSAGLAAGYQALSADHLEYSSEAGVAALAAAGSVAVLLPGAYYYLQEARRPPVESFRRHRVPMAVASDYNPGSSPLLSLRLAMNMACLLFGLTPAEALLGVTRHAALALGIADGGQLVAGAPADFVIWSGSEDPAALSTTVGEIRPRALYRAGLRIA